MTTPTKFKQLLQISLFYFYTVHFNVILHQNAFLLFCNAGYLPFLYSWLSIFIIRFRSIAQRMNFNDHQLVSSNTEERFEPACSMTCPSRPAAMTCPSRPAAMTCPSRPTAMTCPSRPAAMTCPSRPAAMTCPSRPTAMTCPTAMLGQPALV